MGISPASKIVGFDCPISTNVRIHDLLKRTPKLGKAEFIVQSVEEKLDRLERGNPRSERELRKIMRKRSDEGVIDTRTGQRVFYPPMRHARPVEGVRE